MIEIQAKNLNSKYLITLLVFHSINVLFQIFFVDKLMIGFDSALIINGARSIIQGDGYTGSARDFWPPLFSIIIILGNFTISDWFLAGKLITYLSSIIFLFYSYKSLKLLWNETIAIYSVLVLVLSPTITLYSTIVANQMFFSALIAVGIYLFLKHKEFEPNHSQKSNYFLIMSGMLMGLATLTRYTGYIIFISFLIILYIITYKQSKIQFLFKKLPLFALSFILFQIPWYIINLLDFGTILYEKNYLNYALFYYKNEENVFWSIYSHNYSSYIDVLVNHSIFEHIDHLLFNIQILLYELIYLIPLFVLGLIFLNKTLRNHKFPILFSILVIIPFIVVHLISLTKIRFFIPIFPLILGILFVNIQYLIEFLANIKKFVKIKMHFTKQKRSFHLLIIVLIVIIPLVQPKNFLNMVTVYHSERNLDNEIDPVFVANVLMNVTSNMILMTIHPTYSYYTGLKYLNLEQIPNLTLEERLQSITLESDYYKKIFLNNRSDSPSPLPNYLIIDLLVAKEIPEIDFLFYEWNGFPEYLKIVDRNNKVVVFEVNTSKLVTN